MTKILRKNKVYDEGTVLLTTLLVMAIMAALAVAMIDDIRFALKRTANVTDYAQADWYVLGAEDYVSDVLAATLNTVEDNTAKNETLRTINPLILPLDDGAMSLNIRDGSHCFNLTSLTNVTTGEMNEDAQLYFIQTMDALGVPLSEAERLHAKLTDWADKDQQSLPGGAEDGDYLRRQPPLRTANAPFASVMEIRAVEGVTQELYDALRPWLCIAGAEAGNKFNINLAEPWQAPLLAGLLGGADALPLATQLILERPPQGYDESLTENPLLQNSGIEDITGRISQTVSYAPNSLWVELNLSYRKAQRARSFHFNIDNDRPVLTYRGWGRESFRLILRPESETQESYRR